MKAEDKIIQLLKTTKTGSVKILISMTYEHSSSYTTTIMARKVSLLGKNQLCIANINGNLYPINDRIRNKDGVLNAILSQVMTATNKQKYYAFMPFFHWGEIMDEKPEPDGVKVFGEYVLANICKTTDYNLAMDLYAETACPASQLVEANSWEELDEKIEKIKKNFSNPEWVNELEKHL
jgi:hypothetical protein